MRRHVFPAACILLIATGLCGEGWAQTSQRGAAQIHSGAQSVESAPYRRQQWLVPTPDERAPSHALLFRPPGAGPFRIALIAHASTQNKIRRAQVAQPEYSALVAALVTRGFAVVIPQRPGHGATGGVYAEDQGECADPDYRRAGRATAAAIWHALTFIQAQPFAKKEGAVIIGHSAGGWGALALADRSPREISAIIAFAPGRGGRADDRAGQVCAPDRLIGAAADFGRQARVPVRWLVAENDSYFAPALSRQMADAFRAAGKDRVSFAVLPPFGSDGHGFAEAASVSEFGALLDETLNSAAPKAKRP